MLKGSDLREKMKTEYLVEVDGWECKMNVSFYDPRYDLYRTATTIRALPDGKKFGREGLCSKEFLEDDTAVYASLHAVLPVLKMRYAATIKESLLG